MAKLSNGKLAGKLSLAVIAMFGFAFAMVPLYNVLCDALGINGKPTGRLAYQTGQEDKSRWVTVQFIAINDRNMDWAFKPLVSSVKIHPGELTTVEFFAKNPEAQAVVAQAIPSIAPSEGAKYLQKTECFCFSQQTLKAGEEVNMPVKFYIEPSLPDYIHTLTLSYTLFNVTQKAKPDGDAVAAK